MGYPEEGPGGWIVPGVYILPRPPPQTPPGREKKGGRGMPGLMGTGGGGKKFCGLTGAGVTGASSWRGEKRHGRKEP